MVAAPDYLDAWPDAQRVFRRIVDKLLGRGEWEDIFLSGAATAALSCACYRRACEAYGARDPLTLETRTITVEWLRSMEYIKSTPTELDSEGRDQGSDHQTGQRFSPNMMCQPSNARASSPSSSRICNRRGWSPRPARRGNKVDS